MAADSTSRAAEQSVRKKGREAVCKLLSHQFGWELRLFIGAQTEIVRTQVCRSQEEVPATGEACQAALIEKGWSVKPTAGFKVRPPVVVERRRNVVLESTPYEFESDRSS